jgi:hypothetical protein
MIWKHKKAQTSVFIGIISFWIILSLLLTSYQGSGAPSMHGGYIGINASYTQNDISDNSNFLSTGLSSIWNFVKMFFKLTTYYFPVFESVAATIISGAFLLILKITTIWLLIRLVRGV